MAIQAEKEMFVKDFPITQYECDYLRGIAWDIWSGIWPDVCVNQAEAESYEMDDIIEVAFDASRLREARPEWAEVWESLCELVGYQEARRIVVNAGIRGTGYERSH